MSVGIFRQNNALFHFFGLGASILANVRGSIHFGAKPPILWQSIPKPCNKVTSVVLSLDFNGFLWKPVGPCPHKFW